MRDSNRRDKLHRPKHNTQAQDMVGIYYNNITIVHRIYSASVSIYIHILEDNESSVGDRARIVQNTPYLPTLPFPPDPGRKVLTCASARCQS